MYLFQLTGMVKSKNLQYICELFHETTGIPVFYTDIDWNILFDFAGSYAYNPLFDSPSELFVRLFDQTDKIIDYPVLKTTQFLENFFLIRIINEQIHTGNIVAGPSLTQSIDEFSVYSLFTANGSINHKQKKALVEYYRGLPVVGYKKLVSAGMLLYYLVYNKKLDSAAVIEKNAPLLDIDIWNKTSSTMSEIRQYQLFHHTPMYEKRLAQCIREGNREKLLAHLRKSHDGEPGMLSKNPLRNQKNLFICSVTIAARAAIEGGLDSELAFTLSDSYIQHVEELNEIGQIASLYLKMLTDFTCRVHRLKSMNYSNTIIKCRDYITNHIYENITLSQLSKVLSVSSNYLSEKFKKEVGMTISEFIQKEKVEEAKRLLSSTNNSILDICVSLNFTDQSYFTKIFKKVTGITPNQYRKTTL
ncbi:MAG: AraC family transcriptional regulator [Bacillota bacterium]|jgi:AraC-like DNA-binding protein|nr:AraC family transcriptional regulator [Bacillota bacterium]NLV62518.1 AraC family transcriptional regulator [Clostridiaceae bacterium]